MSLANTFKDKYVRTIRFGFGFFFGALFSILIRTTRCGAKEIERVYNTQV